MRTTERRYGNIFLADVLYNNPYEGVILLSSCGKKNDEHPLTSRSMYSKTFNGCSPFCVLLRSLMYPKLLYSKRSSDKNMQCSFVRKNLMWESWLPFRLWGCGPIGGIIFLLIV